MAALIFIIFISWLKFRDVLPSQHHLAADIVSTYLIPALDTEMLFRTSMAINAQWSISAAHALSSRVEYLSINQMESIKRRIKRIIDAYNTSSELHIIKQFANYIDCRNLSVIKFCDNPEMIPIQIRMNWKDQDSKHFIFKMHPDSLSCRYYRILIDALIVEKNDIHLIKERQCRVVTNIGSHPLFEFHGSKIVLFPSFISKNKMHYHKREEFDFMLDSNDLWIIGYEIQILSQRLFMQRGIVRHYGVGHVRVAEPAQLVDVFAVKLSLRNDSNPCFRLNPFTHQGTSDDRQKCDSQFMCSESLCKLCILQ